MYIPAPVPKPVRLYSADGNVYTYASLEAFVELYGIHWIRYSIGPAFRYCACAVKCESLVACENHRCCAFVLRDHGGEVVSLDQCEKLWRTRVRTKTRSRYDRFRYWNGVGPVPHTGNSGRGYAYRRIRTRAEHRAAQAVVSSEGEPPFRAARNLNNLPNAWDDRHVASREDRSWKRYRLTRWKE